MDMIFAPFMRRWVILVSGVLLLISGVVVLSTNLSIALEWAEYAPVSGMAFYPGLSSAHVATNGLAGVAFGSYANFSGQIAVALGVALVAGWAGFALGKRA